MTVTCTCGFTEERGKEDITVSEKTKNKDIRIIDDKNRLAVHDHECEKCGYDKAELIEKGVSYSDEDDVIIFKCGKCGHSKMQEAKVT